MDVSSPRGLVIPNAAQGLHILLVDHDTSSLLHMASMLEEQFYKVTTTELASMALSLIGGREFSYDLVIAEVDMPDMSGFALLNQILLIEEDIPIILMSSSGNMDMAKKALNAGACFFLFKPVQTQDLIKVWQHVLCKRGRRTNFSNVVENKEDQTVQVEKFCDANQEDNALGFIRDPVKGKACYLGDGQGSQRPENVVDERQAKKDNKFIQDGNDKTASDEYLGKRKNVEKEKKKKNDDEKNNSPKKKARLIWTPELHFQFVQAIATLGEERAHPKALLREMDIPGLTHRHIASHLQKYRKQLNKIREQFLKDPPIFESMMNGKPTHLPKSMLMRRAEPNFESMMVTRPTQHFPSHYPPSFGPRGFAHPPTSLNRDTAYYQMDTLKNLLSNPINNLPNTSNYQSSFPNFGNQEFPKLNHIVPTSADQKGKQVVSSFGGYNCNSDATTDNLGMNNIDALLEAWTKELADALGADESLHQEMNNLARYNNAAPDQSLQQEPSKEFYTAHEELAPAPAETESNLGEQTYSYEDLATILDDSYGGGEGIKGSSSEPPEKPMVNNIGDDDIMNQLNNEDFAEFFNIFPDCDDDSF